MSGLLQFAHQPWVSVAHLPSSWRAVACLASECLTHKKAHTDPSLLGSATQVMLPGEHYFVTL